MKAIVIKNLSKKYPIYSKPSDKLKEMLSFGRKRCHQEFWALQDINLEIGQGSTVGIIGQNGSGKSTLLQLVAGILRQTRGDVFVNGKVSALLELGSGFNPEFTGRENVFMNGAILGLSHRQMEERFDRITGFAEIGDFIEQPVKTYSSGMFMRLAFAVAIHVDPDILLVDEALAVGDLVFQHRCMHKINRLKEAGKTILFVTHDLAAVTKFCDRAILLDQGRLLEDGKPESVVQKYCAMVYDRERKYRESLEEDSDHKGLPSYAPEDAAITPVSFIPNVDHRFGTGDASLLGLDLLNTHLTPVREVKVGDTVAIRISALCNKQIQKPIIGFTLRDRLGVQISASNTSYEGKALPPGQPGDVFTVDFTIHLPDIAPGSYSISPAVASGTLFDHDMCDWIDNALIFQLENPKLIYGSIKLPVEIKYAVHGPDALADKLTNMNKNP